MKPGRIIRMKRITREMVRLHRDARVFVFGDNMEGRGLGGQAREMRGEPNAIGVPTKWRPDMGDGAFFTDADWKENADVRHAVFGAFREIKAELERGKDVVIPADGLGTGLAELPKRAPIIHGIIESSIRAIQENYP